MKTKSKFPKIYMAIILLFMYVPIFFVILYSFNDNRINSIWTGFSLKWYRELWLDKDIQEALLNSVILASLSSLGAGIIGTLGAFGMSRVKFFGKGALEYGAQLPIMTPEVILGLLFLVFFSSIGIPLGMGTLLIAHTAFCIPYVYMMVKARLAGLDPSYAEAARDLGASEARAFWDIIFPALAPAIFSGMLLAFAMSMDDVVISIFVNGAKFNTLPVRIYTQLKTAVSPKINALCTIMFVFVTTIVVISEIVRTVGDRRIMNLSKEEE